METQQTTRKVHQLGNSKAITLPEKWVRENKIEQGDRLLLIYNGIVKVIPIFEVRIEGDSVWFIWKEEKAGLTITEVKRLVGLNGFGETVRQIKDALVKRRNYPDSFPISLIKENLLQFAIEFVK